MTKALDANEQVALAMAEAVIVDAHVGRLRVLRGPDRNGVRIDAPNAYLTAAARLLLTHASGSIRGYCCRVCDGRAGGTGAGAWFTEEEGLEHALTCHPAEVREVGTAAALVIEAAVKIDLRPPQV